jgi:hypothetical protein
MRTTQPVQNNCMYVQAVPGGSCKTCADYSLGHLSRNNKTYLSFKLNSYGDKYKRNFKESELLHIH